MSLIQWWRMSITRAPSMDLNAINLGIVAKTKLDLVGARLGADPVGAAMHNLVSRTRVPVGSTTLGSYSPECNESKATICCIWLRVEEDPKHPDDRVGVGETHKSKDRWGILAVEDFHQGALPEEEVFTLVRIFSFAVTTWFRKGE